MAIRRAGAGICPYFRSGAWNPAVRSGRTTLVDLCPMTQGEELEGQGEFGKDLVRLFDRQLVECLVEDDPEIFPFPDVLVIHVELPCGVRNSR